MRKQLNLSNVHRPWELYDKFLRKDAETLAVPADQVVGIAPRSCKLRDWVPCVLAGAVEHFEVDQLVDLLRFLLFMLR